MSCHQHQCEAVLSEADYTRLQDLLLAGFEAGEGGMPLDVAHGFLTAVLSGPRLVLPLEWLPRVLGGAGGGELTQLVMGLYQDILQDLEHGHYGPVVMHQPLEGEPPLPLPYGWCQGYVTGLQLHGEAAIDAAGNDPEAAGYLTPIATFLMYEDDQLLDPPQPAAHRANAEELGPAAQGLFHWWRSARAAAAPPS